MIELAIIILNYRTPDLTIQCLRSIEQELEAEPDWRVVVVDNNSGDDSIDSIQEAIDVSPSRSQISLAASAVNGGFSAGNNHGIARSKAKFYLLLNSDTIVAPGAFKSLVQFAKDNTAVGLVGPRLTDRDGTEQISQFRFHSPLSEFLSSAQVGALDGLLSGFRVATTADEQAATQEAEWISFACVLIRREVIEAVGLLDDGYFMYFEDVDFCRRAKAKGWRIVRHMDASVVHLKGGSSPVKKALATRTRVPLYHYASRNRYYGKFYAGALGVVLANTCRIAGRSLSFFREALTGRPRSSCKSEYRDIWMNWTKPVQKFTPED